IRPCCSNWSMMPTSADLLSPARSANAVCELPGLAATSESTVSEPVGNPCGAETAIDRAVSALRNTRTRGPTEPASSPQSSSLDVSSATAYRSHSQGGFATGDATNYLRAMEIRPLHPLFAAELLDANLADEPTPELVETVE